MARETRGTFNGEGETASLRLACPRRRATGRNEAEVEGRPRGPGSPRRLPLAESRARAAHVAAASGPLFRKVVLPHPQSLGTSARIALPADGWAGTVSARGEGARKRKPGEELVEEALRRRTDQPKGETTGHQPPQQGLDSGRGRGHGRAQGPPGRATLTGGCTRAPRRLPAGDRRPDSGEREPVCRSRDSDTGRIPLSMTCPGVMHLDHEWSTTVRTPARNRLGVRATLGLGGREGAHAQGHRPRLPGCRVADPQDR